MFRLFFILILFFTPGIIFSQDAVSSFDQAYGPDPLLYNGRKYSFYLPSGTQGHQFLYSSEFRVGSVRISGKTFGNILLNYDIFNQQLVMKISDPTGAESIIELSKAWLEAFHIENKDFILFGKDEEKRFYQVLGNGPAYILYYFSKNIRLDATYGTTQYAFKPPDKTMYLLRGNDLIPFRNNRTFFNVWDENQQIELKKYLKKNKINVKKASDKAMLDMIGLMNNL